jgi:hypothetical protein
VRPTAGIGERTVLAGAVVTDRVAADELGSDRDLDRLADHRDLDLAAPELGSDPIAGSGEADTAAGVDLAGDRGRGCARSHGLGQSHPMTESGRPVGYKNPIVPSEQGKCLPALDGLDHS